MKGCGVGLGGGGGGVPAPGRGAPADGTNGGAAGAPPVGALGGVKGGGVGGVRNSGIAPDGDGGVAVAVIGPDSSRRRGGTGISARGAGGGGGGAMYGADAGAAGVVVRGAEVPGVATPLGAGMVMTPLQTEHRARTPLGGTLAGSTRKIERQSGQLTFIHSLRSCEHRVSPAGAPAV
ncbi:MAG TPA: hypothetical protein VJ840_06510 [Gemmatimonadaceae bacterium]|nr:hypothetical protein [Gemmatimonadaceae bacterium]